MTTKDKVNSAFRLLRKAGYFAKQNFLCCQSCAWAATPKDANKVVFYHAQDNDAWSGKELEEPLFIAWSGDCKEICDIFSSVGLKVEHDGSENTRIKILPE